MFQVGALVEVLDGSNIENYGPGWVRGMDNYVGCVYKVREVSKNKHWYILSEVDSSEEIPFYWDEKGLIPYENVAIPELGDVMDLMF